MKKGSIHGDSIGIVIVYATKNEAEKYVHQQVIKLEEEIDFFLILMTSTPLSQKLRKEVGKKSARIYILFKCPWNMTKIDSILCIKQTTTHLKELKSYRMSSPTTVELNWKSITERKQESLQTLKN